MGIKVVKGHRYLLGFIGYSEAEKMWLAGKVTGLTELVETLTGVSRKHLQSAYTGLQKSLQQEWAFVQMVSPGIGDAFGPVEKELRETFVPAPFKGLGEGTPKQGVTRLPLKQAGLSLDGVLCHHRTPRCSNQGPGGVTEIRSLCLSPGG